MGCVETLPAANGFPGTFGGQPTALHVQLVLELLLLCWPKPHVQEPTVTSADAKVFPMEQIAGVRWDWLLLMIALLQQTSTEQKQRIMRERGPLLMQLLYQALLEDEGVRGACQNGLVTVSGDMAWHCWYVTVTDVQVKDTLKYVKIWWAASAPMAVTMVLQNLLFESLPESLVDPKTARIGRVIIDLFRKCGTWGGLGGC
jgi:hypothetical protein